MLAARGEGLDQVVSMEIADSILVPRITGRLIHAPSGRSYHKLFNPPAVPMKDDLTGEALTQRPDDTAETLVPRLAAFHKQTQPVIEYYRSKGVLSSINADQPFKKVYDDITKALAKKA